MLGSGEDSLSVDHKGNKSFVVTLQGFCDGPEACGIDYAVSHLYFLDWPLYRRAVVAAGQYHCIIRMTIHHPAEHEDCVCTISVEAHDISSVVRVVG